MMLFKRQKFTISKYKFGRCGSVSTTSVKEISTITQSWIESLNWPLKTESIVKEGMSQNWPAKFDWLTFCFLEKRGMFFFMSRTFPGECSTAEGKGWQICGSDTRECQMSRVGITERRVPDRCRRLHGQLARIKWNIYWVWTKRSHQDGQPLHYFILLKI